MIARGYGSAAVSISASNTWRPAARTINCRAPRTTCRWPSKICRGHRDYQRLTQSNEIMSASWIAEIVGRASPDRGSGQRNRPAVAPADGQRLLRVLRLEAMDRHHRFELVSAICILTSRSSDRRDLPTSRRVPAGFDAAFVIGLRWHAKTTNERGHDWSRSPDLGEVMSVATSIVAQFPLPISSSGWLQRQCEQIPENDARNRDGEFFHEAGCWPGSHLLVSFAIVFALCGPAGVLDARPDSSEVLG